MAGKVNVLLDTSVLINFVRINRLDLLRDHSAYEYFVTNHVRDEVLEHFREQYEAVDAAVKSGVLTELCVDAAGELADFGKLVSMKNLGMGECSAIAVAKHRRFVLGIDDVTARKMARRFHADLKFTSTQEVMVALIRENVLSVEEADHIKEDWEKNHRFRLRFSSFGEKL